jgi:cell fate (sporulation/competence/biofilm development) regulator YmcA (YheA/YmcA/DUF963 family)
MNNENPHSKSTQNEVKTQIKDWNPIMTVRKVAAFLVGGTTLIMGVVGVYEMFVVGKLREENNKLKLSLETIEKNVKLSSAYLNLKSELSISNGRSEFFGSQLNNCITEKGKMESLSYKIKSIEDELETCKTSKREALSESNRAITKLSERADILKRISALQFSQEEAEKKLKNVGNRFSERLTYWDELEAARLQERIKMLQEQITALTAKL